MSLLIFMNNFTDIFEQYSWEETSQSIYAKTIQM